MDQPSPLHQSPFTKNKKLRNENQSHSSNSSQVPNFKLTMPSPHNSIRDRTHGQSVEMQSVQSSRARFSIGEEITEGVEYQPSSSPQNTNHQPTGSSNRINFDNRQYNTSTLQNLFVPPGEKPKKPTFAPSANPFKTLKGKNNPTKNSHLTSWTPSHYSDSERYEDVNQLTAQTMSSDFVVPTRPAWRSGWNEDPPDFNPPQESKLAWYAKLLRFFKKGRREVNVALFKHVVKSSIAFFLASLIVIIEPVNRVIGSTSYMAPLVTILFDSTHTIGAQLETTFLACCFMLVGLLYYLLANGLYITYNRSMVPDDAVEPIQDGAFILAIFLFLAMFILGWLRAKFAKFSTPSALLSLILLLIMTNIQFGTKDFSFETFGRLLSSSLIGIGISFVVNLVIWPESASQDLGKSIDITLRNTLRSIQTLTSCFILDENTLSITVKDLEDLHTRSMTAVNTLIRAGKEARYEYTYSVHPPTDYKQLTDNIMSLQQQLGGLNLAIQRERQLLALNKTKEDQRISPLSSRSSSHVELKSLSLPPSPSALSLTKMAEDLMPVTPEIDPILARSLIHDIIHSVKDPLLSLNHLCAVAIEAASRSLAQENDLDNMEADPEDPPEKDCCCSDKDSINSYASRNFDHEKNPEDSIDLKDLDAIAHLLENSISEFELAEGRCLHRIHQQLLFIPHQHTPFPEPMLIVFSGIFSVREFAKELVRLLREIPRFQSLRPVRSVGTGILRTGPVQQKKLKSWWRPRVGFTKWLQGYCASEEPRQVEDYAANSNLKDEIDSINQEFNAAQEGNHPTHHLFSDFDLEFNLEDDPLQLPNQRWLKPEYGHFPVNSTSLGTRFRQGIWKFFRRLNTYEIRFGLKLTLTMVLLTFPAFIPKLAAVYLKDWKGQWGAIAAMFILNQTIGGTLSTGLARLLGTIIGAAWGYLTYLAGHKTDNIYLVIVMVWILNAPAWLTIINTSYSRVGINCLVAYCLVLFVDYRKNDNATMLEIAALRLVSVLVGLVASMVISATLWPYVARNQVRKLVAGLMADMGVTFGQVATLCMSPRTEGRDQLDQHIRSQQYKLQKRIMHAKTLLVFAKKEPRLKGPFPAHIYQEQLRVLQDVLDQLVAMRGAVLQISPEVQATVIFPFNAYRKFMVSSVILYFYVLAGALLSKHPLPPYPPPIHAIRYKLMFKTRSAMMRRYQRSHGRPVPGGSSALRRDMSMGALTSLLSSSAPQSPATPPPDDLAVIRRDFNHIYWYTYLAGLVRLFEDVELLGHNVAGLVGEATLPGLDQVIIRDP